MRSCVCYAESREGELLLGVLPRRTRQESHAQYFTSPRGGRRLGGGWGRTGSRLDFSGNGRPIMARLMVNLLLSGTL